MKRVKIRELALIAVAGGMIAFEVVGLRGVLPTASHIAAVAAASALEDASRAATGATRVSASGATMVASRARLRSDGSRVSVIAVMHDRSCAATTTCRSLRRANQVRGVLWAAMREMAL
jgi:hypothetical protein